MSYIIYESTIFKFLIMKKLIYILIILFCFIFKSNYTYSQFPTYNLTVKNFNFIAPDSLMFDIFLLHTNYPTPFVYSLGQYYLKFNPSFGNGGSLTFTILESNMDSLCRPRNPSVLNGMLRLSTNVFPGTGIGCDVSYIGTGTLLGRFLLTTTINFLPLDSFRLRWRNSATGNPYTKLFAIVNNISFEITDSSGHYVDTIMTSTSEPSNEIHPANFILYQNYPNPFNPVTNISYELRVTNYVSLRIFDIAGKEVQTLVNKKQNAGYYSVEWDASGYSSGVYFYKLETENFIDTKRMILLK